MEKLSLISPLFAILIPIVFGLIRVVVLKPEFGLSIRDYLTMLIPLIVLIMVSYVFTFFII